MTATGEVLVCTAFGLAPSRDKLSSPSHGQDWVLKDSLGGRVMLSSRNVDIWIVRSPEDMDDSVDEGEWLKPGTSESGLPEEFEVEYESKGFATFAEAMNGGELDCGPVFSGDRAKALAGSVDARRNPALVAGAAASLEVIVFAVPKRFGSLCVRVNDLCVWAGEVAGAAGTAALPTQSLQSRAFPSARSQRPISRGERPDNFAHARFE